MLQKSKAAAPQIFRENKKRGTITDSYTLDRVAEAAGEFDARGSGLMPLQCAYGPQNF